MAGLTIPSATFSSTVKSFTLDEVTKHNKENDLWVVINSNVYDLSRFAQLHPGGKSVLLNQSIVTSFYRCVQYLISLVLPPEPQSLRFTAGQDATTVFYSLHRQEVLERPQYTRLIVGKIQDVEEQVTPRIPGSLSSVPYAEPTWLSKEFTSPYYTDNHRLFQRKMREFVDTVLREEALKCEEKGTRISQEVLDKMAETNLLAMRLGPGLHLHGRILLGSVVKPDQFDYFHELILDMEQARLGTRGFIDGMLSGMVIGLPPVFNHGSPELKARIVPEIMEGRKFIALAITEAFAGSDVNGLQTTAVRNGDFWIVNGTKKWITNGTFADYFTVGCQTEEGLTVMLIERTEGVETRPIKTAYSSTAGTAYVTFDNVPVPLGNTLGKVGQGLSVILSNFNHERWTIIAMCTSAQRVIVEECMKWTSQRIVAGKPLSSQPVVRAKLGDMISKVEACQNWLESITDQMNHMSHRDVADKLAGRIALLKQFASKAGREIAEDAAQIFGGRALTPSGMGRLIENYHRTSGYDAILGGTEDVLKDLGVRQALKKMPSNVRL
ncbi:hypothetical protein D9758_013941 [Tetrapyrgos nigripes]|uniref:Cytochrome b5 heme-binding domain-containing protein n=1 Tax=Tetrapyrgos nigripes TaxID=182062 RepID=A0A8H5FLC9_9AGAR|nr:hypothetical protein D9758_013941 [Tetrapyrgos nigripes]